MSYVDDIESELRSREHMGHGGGNAYDSDSDDDMGGPRVGCAQQ